MSDKYDDLRRRLERLNDPMSRWELGEEARRAELAALAEQYLPDLVASHDRLAAVLYMPELPPREDNTDEQPAR